MSELSEGVFEGLAEESYRERTSREGADAATRRLEYQSINQSNVFLPNTT